MVENRLGPEHVTPLPGSAVGAVAWRSKGQLYITVIAKATFAFAPDAPMPRTEPQELLCAEVHHGNNPGRSIQLTSDLAPYLSRAEVLFTGSAQAPTESPVYSLPVRLAIFAEQRPLLDKRLLAQDPAGFRRMPIVYERTWCGVDETENPLGVPVGAGQPSFTDPARPEHPAGFGPIGRSWPTRKRLLGVTPRAALDGPIAEIPDGFDWAYYQAAPLDQRIDSLRGDEWIILEGLHPSRTRLRTRLPGARARARVHGLEAFGVSEGAALELSADTLRLDGDAQRCTVVWRRSFAVAGEAALAAVRLVAGVEIAGEAQVWPAPPIARPSPPGLLASRAPLEPRFPGTLNLSPEQEDAAAHRPGLPFAARPGAAAPSAVVIYPLVDPPALIFAPPPEPALPSPLPPPPAVPLGLRAASDAAAGAMSPSTRAPESAPPITLEEPAAPARVLDLLWFDGRSLPRIRKQPAWRTILERLDDEPLDPDLDDPDFAVDPAAAEERREIFEVLAKGEPLSDEALRDALKKAVRRDGRFVAPLVLLEGELSLPFDELATLEAVVAVVGPLGGGDEKLKAALAAGKEFLSTQGPLSSRSAAEGLSAAIKAACGAGKRAVPLAEVEAQIEQGLLDRRRYQRRAVFGGAMLRGLLWTAGGAEALPAYLPEALAEVLPMFPRFGVRVIAEGQMAVDQRETQAVALRVVGVARRVSGVGEQDDKNSLSAPSSRRG
jgi:hypothetical protein